MAPKPIDSAAFQAWLRSQGAEVFPPTNQWEIARFRAVGSLHIIYQKQSGIVTAGPFAMECLAAFRRGANLAMGYTAKRHHLSTSIRDTLAIRDGEDCFFCGLAMAPEDRTIEHLVAKNKGGPDHQDNLVLAHEACNRRAGSLPLFEKIKIHVNAKIAKLSEAKV